MSRWNATGVASYPEYAQASTGGPSYPAYPVINEPAAQVNPNARLQFGDNLIDKWGNTFCYVRAVEALAVGQVVKIAVAGVVADYPAAGTISASTTVKKIFTNITTTIDETSLSPHVFLASPGPTTPFLKPIKNQIAIGTNTTFEISLPDINFGIGKYDGDQLAAIPTTGEGVAIVRLYNVAVCGAAATASNSPCGVAMGTVSALGGTLIQTAGLASVLVDGTTDTTIGFALTTAASGVAVATTATPTALEVLARVGRAMMATTDNSSKLSPVLLQLYQRI